MTLEPRDAGSSRHPDIAIVEDSGEHHIDASIAEPTSTHASGENPQLNGVAIEIHPHSSRRSRASWWERRSGSGSREHVKRGGCDTYYILRGVRRDSRAGVCLRNLRVHAEEGRYSDRQDCCESDDPTRGILRRRLDMYSADAISYFSSSGLAAEFGTLTFRSIKSVFWQGLGIFYS